MHVKRKYSTCATGWCEYSTEAESRTRTGHRYQQRSRRSTTLPFTSGVHRGAPKRGRLDLLCNTSFGNSSGSIRCRVSGRRVSSEDPVSVSAALDHNQENGTTKFEPLRVRTAFGDCLVFLGDHPLLVLTFKPVFLFTARIVHRDCRVTRTLSVLDGWHLSLHERGRPRGAVHSGVHLSLHVHGDVRHIVDVMHTGYLNKLLCGSLMHVYRDVHHLVNELHLRYFDRSLGRLVYGDLSLHDHGDICHHLLSFDRSLNCLSGGNLSLCVTTEAYTVSWMNCAFGLLTVSRLL